MKKYQHYIDGGEEILPTPQISLNCVKTGCVIILRHNVSKAQMKLVLDERCCIFHRLINDPKRI